MDPGQIVPRLAVSYQEAEECFERHQAEFTNPLRIRARHIFLAAPQDSSPELIEAKRRAMQDLIAGGLSHGEDFAQLASATSEDEATKNPGGDLGFFSADRMPRSRQSSEPSRSMNFAGQLAQRFRLAPSRM